MQSPIAQSFLSPWFQPESGKTREGRNRPGSHRADERCRLSDVLGMTTAFVAFHYR